MKKQGKTQVFLSPFSFLNPPIKQRLKNLGISNTPWFDYALLGDYIVIADPVVAKSGSHKGVVVGVRFF